MSLSCIIVEDQPPAQRILQKYIDDIEYLALLGIFTDAVSAMSFLHEHQVDILFLDIHLPKISGIDFLKMLQPKPKVILTTAFSEYAIDGYELDVVDYLLKPFSFERFMKAFLKAKSQLVERPSNLSGEARSREDESKNFIFVKSGSSYFNLQFDEIEYIKSDGDYTEVYMKERKHLIAHPLKFWVSILPDETFSQVHKSYIVQVPRIKKITGNQLFIGEKSIPIGRTFKVAFVKKYLV